MVSVLECALLAEDVYHQRPTVVQGFRPVGVPNGELYCGGNEFAGGAYAGAAGVGVIAFRGTREMEDWKGANLQIIRRRLPVGQFGCALAYFATAHRALARAGCSRYIVVGHSLGGGLAAVVAGTVNWVPVRGVTFNAPGLGEFSARDPGGALDRANAGNVYNFRSRTDVVSCWGMHIGRIFDVPGAGFHGIRAFIGQLGASEYGAWDL